jgi:hypothetical protein
MALQRRRTERVPPAAHEAEIRAKAEIDLEEPAADGDILDKLVDGLAIDRRCLADETENIFHRSDEKPEGHQR